MAKYLQIFLVVFLPSLLFAQNQNIKFEYLNVESGLASNRVHCILQDSKGFMWFGTENGLNKFDGHKFTTYKPDLHDPSSIGHIFCWSIFEDFNGDIWIGTYGGGLHKFDREKETFINYQNDPDDPFSLSNNFVNSICQSPADSGKTLWVGTRWGGLNRFSLETEKFYHYQNITADSSKININNIFSMYFDKDGTLWIGTGSSGLINYDPMTDNFICYSNALMDMNRLSNNQITSICQDNGGNIWIGTASGLNKFNRNEEQVTRYFKKTNDKNSLIGNQITSIYQDRSDKLWIGTISGLNILNPETEQFKRIRSNLDIDHSLSDDYVLSIYQDPSGIFWIGTFAGGINKYNPNKKKISHFQIALDNSGNMSSSSVRSIQEDITNNKVLWLGTNGAGLIKYDRNANRYIQFYSQNSPVFIKSIYQNPLIDNAIWIATWGQGLIKLDKKFKQISEQVFFSQNPAYKDANYINTIYEIKNGLILLGTSLGLYQFDCFTKNYISFGNDRDNPNSLSHPNVTSICKDRFGQFWVGTYGGGLNKCRLDLDSSDADFKNKEIKFTHFKNNPEYPQSISNNTITFVYEDNNGNIWIGTHGGGLNKLVTNNTNNYNQSYEEFIQYRTEDGLPSDIIMGILEDDKGNLWLSTNNGISQFDPIHETFRNLDVQDGPQGNEFNRFAYYKNRNGEMFFGGINGFDAFYPDSILSNDHIPPIVLTDFKIHNEPAKLDSGITMKRRIDLAYDQNFFSFEFAALDYADPRKNQYAYMLEGLDEDWIKIGNHHLANYTAVHPGNYTFRVKGSNNDGIWNERGVSLAINIHPPWWQTNWAYFLYVLFVLSMVYGFWRFQTGRLKMKQQMEMEHFEAERLREVDHLKSRFFANISHEFRTPLTLILGPLQKFLSAAKEKETYEDFLAMQRNARRLQQLIDQLLDLSKLDAQRMPLRTKPDNIVQKIRELTSAFSSLAETRNIELRFSADEESIIVYFDPDKLQKVIYNLLGNAFKFTPDGGKVLVEVHIPPRPPSKGGTNGGMLEIRVTDTGPGIPLDQLEHIFDRFYQVDEGSTRTHAGTGIGLALTRDLVHLHHGEIRAESEVGKGTEFIIRLPLGKEHLKPEEIVDIPLNPLYEVVDPSKGETESSPLEGGARRVGDVLADIPAKKPATRSRTPKSAPLILIVEDNQDMRRFLRNCLTECYDIIEAENGEWGVEAALEKIPDLIVSDVMIPDIDGFELCRKLKSDERTCHIPIILLTARASRESKVEGLETGADDYIVKPFDEEELRVRIKNLIDQRRKLRERFQREILLPPGQVVASSCEEKFLQRAIDIVQAQMTDADFGVPGLAMVLGMSRSQLHRKIHALTGLSASRFIRSLRLRRAAELLKQRSGNVAEIAYEVGFNNVPYFHRCFLEQFGKTPSQYISPPPKAPKKQR